jgi:hypothetical protein
MPSITLRLLVTASTVLLLIASAVTAGDGSRAIGKKAMEFTLEDQFEKTWSWTRNYRGKPTVLVLSDMKGSSYLDNWTKPLTERFKGRVQFAAFADVSSAPSFMHGFVRGRIRTSSEHPIMLDFTGDVFTYYHVQSGVPNIVFIDETETVRLHTWGTGSEEYVKAFADHLEKTLNATDR